MKRIEDRPNGRWVKAWVIMNGDRLYGRIVALYTGQSVQVDAWGCDAEGKPLFFQGKAKGYGYDKLTAALAGFRVVNHVCVDHGQEYAGLRGLEHAGYTVIQAV